MTLWCVFNKTCINIILWESYIKQSMKLHDEFENCKENKQEKMYERYFFPDLEKKLYVFGALYTEAISVDIRINEMGTNYFFFKLKYIPIGIPRCAAPAQEI